MITCDLITEKTCDHYGIGRKVLMGRYGSTLVRDARDVAWLLCRRLAGRSYPEIARFMGGFDHTTVLAGVRRAERKEATGDALAISISKIRKAVIEDHRNAVEKRELLSDAEVLEIADGVVTGAGGVITEDQVAALALGARRFAARAVAAQNAAVRKEQTPMPINIATVPEIIRQRAHDVAAAWSDVEQSQFTSGEAAARMKLEKTLKTLKTTLEKLK